MTDPALAGENMICLALLPWHGPWKAYHQLISRQAGANRVLCVDPPVSLRAAIGAIRTRVPRGPVLQQISPGLLLYRPPRLLATTPRSRPFTWMTENLRLAHARRLARQHGFDSPILWVFNPMLANAVGTFGEKLVVYHVVDNYVEYAPRDAVALRDTIRRNEEALLRRADVVFTVSSALQARCRAYTPHTYLVPNGVDVEKFRSARAAGRVPPDVRPIPRPVIGYVGAIQSTVDLGLLREIAATHPEWSLVLVGPDELGDDRTEFAALLACANVHYLGLKPVDEVPYYISCCDVCVMPDYPDERSADIDSLKLYEYLACGRPVVSTDLPSVHRFRPFVRIAGGRAEFVQHLVEALRDENAAGVEQRMAFVEAHSWARRVERLNQLIRSRLSARTIAATSGSPA